MKKNRLGWHIHSEKFKKFLNALKLLLIIVMCTSHYANANGLKSKKLISLKLKNVSMLDVIRNIEKQSAYKFVYSTTAINEIGKVSIKSKNTNIEKVLNKCLEKTDYTYKLKNEVIIIKHKPKALKQETQAPKIKGVVKDKKGLPIPGVTVRIKGTRKGVSTNIKGEFEIDAKINETLIFSCVGFKNTEFKIKNTSSIFIKLLEKQEELGTVVVNGYKSIKKDHFTGNATIVSKNEMLKTNTKSVVKALQVFDPSFRIVENNNWGSDPNSLPVINIRGETSIGMDKGMNVELMKQGQRTNLMDNPNLPIFILDGFEVSIQKVYDMDMNRIENITILKDAAATALYGSRAANGVVLVQTIAPKPGKFTVNYNLTTSVQLPDLSDYNLTNSEEKLKAEVFAGVFDAPSANYEILKQIEYNEKLQKILRGIDTDWLAQPLENAVNQRHSIFIEGGSKNIRYGIDGNFDNNNGVMKGSYRDRNGIGFKFIYTYKNLKIKNHISYTKTESENSPYGSFNQYAKMQPYYELKDEQGNYIRNYTENVYSENLNPLYNSTLSSYSGLTKENNITENFDIDYTFLESFRFKTQFSIQKSDMFTESFNDPNETKYIKTEADDKGELYRQYRDDERLNLKTLLTYNKSINKHFVNSVVGTELTRNKVSYNDIRYNGFEVGNLHSPQYAAQQKNKTNYFEDESRLFGFLASANYSYDNTYLLDASFRYDGSSKFGSDKRFAPFWSFGTGVNLHKYNFMGALPWVTRLKIRASYGSTGKVNFPSNTALTTYIFDENNWSKTGGATYLTTLGNTDLKWETTNTLDAGFDLSLFNGKFNLVTTFYNKKTVDLISDLYLRHSSGFNNYKINSGEVTNKGFEINFNAIVLRSSNLIASVYGNLSSNKNEITKLSKAMEEYNNQLNKQYNYTPNEYYEIVTTPFQQYYVGASTTAIYAVRSQGIDPSNGQEKFIKKDGSSTYTWDANDQVVVGDRLPDAKGSFGFNLNYKGLFINASFLYEWGGQIYNSTIRDKVETVDFRIENVDKRAFTDRWKKPGDVVPYLDIKDFRTTKPTSRYVQDNDYLSFNSLAIGYDFESEMVKKWGISKVGLKFTMNDIVRWSTVKVERGLYYPYAKNFSMNLNLSF